jgi:uncharacterized protein (TIGR03437 family)
VATAAAPLVFAPELQVQFVFGLPPVYTAVYAGAAPQMVAGVTQINLQIPVWSYHGLTSLTISIAGVTGASSQTVSFYQQ